jgi:hypothetical protein
MTIFFIFPPLGKLAERGTAPLSLARQTAEHFWSRHVGQKADNDDTPKRRECFFSFFFMVKLAPAK